MSFIKLITTLSLVLAVAFSFASCELEEEYDETRRKSKKETESEAILTSDVEETVSAFETETVIVEETTAPPDTEIFETGVNEPALVPDRFDLTYTCQRTSVLRGESIEIVATVTNISGEDHTWVGSYGEYRAEAVLYIELDGGETYRIEHDGIPMTEEYQRYTASNGESRDTHYTFNIPEDAPEGYYRLRLSYQDAGVSTGTVFGIFDEPDVEVKNYSGITVTRVGASVTPATSLVGESYCNDITGEAYEADGMGAYYYFSSIEYWGTDSFLPELMIYKGDGIKVISSKSNGSFGMYCVRVGDDFNRSESLIYLDGTESLPVGEYYFVICSSEEFRSADGSEWRSTSYEDVFKLIVVEH